MNTTDTDLVYTSGIKSSKIPRLDLIPRNALNRLAERFELGIQRKGVDGAWNAQSKQDCLDDRAFLLDRIAHIIGHALLYRDKLLGVLPNDGDDDAGAIMFGGVLLSEAIERRRLTIPPSERIPVAETNA